MPTIRTISTTLTGTKLSLMAKYITNDSGRKVAVRLTLKEYRDLRFKLGALQLQNDVQKEMLSITKVKMLAPQDAMSIWHPN